MWKPTGAMAKNEKMKGELYLPQHYETSWKSSFPITALHLFVTVFLEASIEVHTSTCTISKQKNKHKNTAYVWAHWEPPQESPTVENWTTQSSLYIGPGSQLP